MYKTGFRFFIAFDIPNFVTIANQIVIQFCGYISKFVVARKFILYYSLNEKAATPKFLLNNCSSQQNKIVMSFVVNFQNAIITLKQFH